MFYRLTLFDMSNDPQLAKIQKTFETLNQCRYHHQSSAEELPSVHQWHWHNTNAHPINPHFEKVRQHLSMLHSMDFVLQSSAQPIQKIKLAVFDMDSTLIQAEVMDELAYAMGIGPQVALITASSMAGELDFEQSFRQRLALLKGFDTAQLDTINQSIKLMPGAESLMQGLQEQGIYCAILSGGFSYFADDLAQRLGMQVAFSNPLEAVAGKLTGQVTGAILDANRKVELMEQLRRRLGFSLDQCLAVGDGANDLPMLNKAGLGVAFHGKPLVRQRAPHQINHCDLDVLLHLI